MFKIKPFVSISLFIFFAVIVAVLVAGLVFYDNQPKGDLGTFASDEGTRDDNQINRNDTTGNTNNQSNFQLIATVVAKHNTVGDCWMIINGKVYNLTSFLKAHPGGAGVMTPYCGQDGSAAYATKDKNNPQAHSSTAQSLLANYYLGDFNQTTNQTNITNTTNVPSPTQGRGGEDEKENDDD